MSLFDQPISRAGTHCEKYDGVNKRFGTEKLLPLWVADMDFAVAEPIKAALTERLEHPIFGYTFPSEELYSALLSWYASRHQWRIDRDKLLLTPGVVPCLAQAVATLTAPSASVLVPTPVYPPFFTVVQKQGRQVIASPLQHTPQGYELDFGHLEQAAKQASMLMLCNPHNPVGRVWRKDELEGLIALALRHNLIVVSDDIHCDLVYAGHTYVPLATLAPPELRLLTLISPSKTFNIPGLNLSALVASHDADKAALRNAFSRAAVNPYNPLTLAAFEAAYRHGQAWLDELMHYLAGNRQWLREAFANVPGICFQPPEATCLIWLNCQGLGMSDAQLRHFFIQQAQLGLNEGISFGAAGAGHMRLNIGTRRALLEQAVNQLRRALAAR